MQKVPKTPFLVFLVLSSSQIQKIAKAAFGDDFTVRNTTEVYLPVYSIEVLNPDGSTFTTYWNALTGDRMTSRPY